MFGLWEAKEVNKQTVMEKGKKKTTLGKNIQSKLVEFERDKSF